MVIHLRVGAWHKTEQFAAAFVAGESHLRQIVQKEIELGEPRLQRDADHFRK